LHLALQSDITQVVPNSEAFAALTSDGQVLTWGAKDCGGESTVKEMPAKATRVYSTQRAFAALTGITNDGAGGAVIAWGDAVFGGDNSACAARLNGIIEVFSSYVSFVALSDGDEIISWGNADFGGVGAPTVVNPGTETCERASSSSPSRECCSLW